MTATPYVSHVERAEREFARLADRLAPSDIQLEYTGPFVARCSFAENAAQSPAVVFVSYVVGKRGWTFDVRLGEYRALQTTQRVVLEALNVGAVSLSFGEALTAIRLMLLSHLVGAGSR